jgi:hypothetical protein
LGGPQRGRPGKLRELHRLVEDHGEALEADLQRYFSTDLREVGTPALSWRRLGVLVRYLPRESATVRALMGEAADWGTVEHLLATLVDVERMALWQRAGNRHAPRPKPMDRPGAPKTGEKRYGGRRRVVTADQMDELAARWAPRRDDGGDADGD